MRAGPPAIAVPVGATWPAVIVGVVIATAVTPVEAGPARATLAAIAGLPMLVAVVATRDVLVIALTRFLGLAHGIRATLDRQVIGRLRRRVRRLLLVALWTTLPLATPIRALDILVLRPWLIVFEMLILRTRLIVLGPRGFRTRLIILWSRLVVLRPRLIIAWMPFRASFMLTTAFLAWRVVGHHLRTNAHHQQTNTRQTPDALHAIPHCGLGPTRKTGKPGPGSARGYQSRELFSQAIKRGDPSVAP